MFQSPRARVSHGVSLTLSPADDPRALPLLPSASTSPQTKQTAFPRYLILEGNQCGKVIRDTGFTGVPLLGCAASAPCCTIGPGCTGGLTCGAFPGAIPAPGGAFFFCFWRVLSNLSAFLAQSPGVRRMDALPSQT
jgi:hypothetical protein